MLQVLIADGSIERNRAFRIEGFPFHTLYATSLQKFEEALTTTTSSWDVVFFSGYFDDWRDWKKGIPLLIEAHRKGNVKTVVCFTPAKQEGAISVRTLRKAGVPAQFIPYSYTNPSTHIIHPVSAEGETL